MRVSASRSRSILVGLTVLVLIIALGELLALILDYQNNIYLQQYVANNSSLLYKQIIGLVLAATGCAFLAYKASTAKPAGRLGRVSLRLRSVSPLIAGFIALIFWITFTIINAEAPSSAEVRQICAAHGGITSYAPPGLENGFVVCRDGYGQYR